MLKKRVLQIFFICLTIFTLWYLDGVFCIKSAHGINQARGLYYQPQNTIDVVMMGSSHVHCDIDTGLLWNEHGIASYDYSAAEQPLWCTYYYLREFCKYQNPKVVVLDLYSPARFKDDYQYVWLNQNLNGMRFSMNKLGMIVDSVEPRKIVNIFPDFITYHGRVDTLKAEDFLYPFTVRKDLQNFKGFTPYLKREPQEEPIIDETASVGVTVKSEIYLTKIIEYTQENDIELFLVVTPYITSAEDEKVYNRLKEIAEYYGVQFNSTNYDYGEIGLDFEKDFNDESHLNYWGAYKFTHYLGGELKRRFEIPDRRGEKGYDSWQKNYEEIAEYVKENT
ncbi:MAG: hypothetical protein K6A61_12020 [Butyrivibrio sp.]|nr:hypothetical protein [Butyrivibrio sp.]